MAEIRVLNAEQTKELLTMKDVIAAVESVYVDKAKGDTEVFPLVFHEFDPGVADMDIKSGWVKGSGIFGLKLVSWFGNNAAKGKPMLVGTVIVCDDETGEPIGMLDGAYVTGIRTGASGALGAKYLARKDSETLLVVGAGHVSSFQVAGVLELMPSIKKVMIVDPIKFEGAKKMVEGLEGILKEELNMEIPEGVTVEAVESLEDATRLADVIITVTPSKAPLIKKAWLKPGTHISCIGADMGDKQEIESAILADAKVYVDDLAQNINVGEIEVPIKEGVIKAEDIISELGHVIIGATKGRENDEEITVYDATGTALLDLVTGKQALVAAEKEDLGVVITL